MSTVTFYTAAGTELVYSINDTKVARAWLQLLHTASPDSLLRQQENSLHGFASAEVYALRCQQLREVCTALSIEVPEVLDQQALNVLHLNFPNGTHGLSKDESAQARKQLMTLNLLVHWIEYELANQTHQRHQYLVNLDFNHDAAHYSQPGYIDQDQLKGFSADMSFGSLHLHYTYTGRHFLEMFDALDNASPIAHFRPQRNFNATCGLIFSEPQDNAARRVAMLKYYNDRGARRFWPHDFEDPRMCIGFYQLGQLQNFDASADARDQLRAQLSTDPIVNWTINDS